MKKEEILTLEVAKELLASFLSKKELPPLPDLPPPPPPVEEDGLPLWRSANESLPGEDAHYISLGPPPPPLPEQESIEFEKKTKREKFLAHGVTASLRQSEREYINFLPKFEWSISGAAMPDLTPFTQIETDAIGLLREAIGNGLNLWGSPLLYDFLIEPLHLCMVEKLEIKSDTDDDGVDFSYQITFKSGKVWHLDTHSIKERGLPYIIWETMFVAENLISLPEGIRHHDPGSFCLLKVEVPTGRITWRFRWKMGNETVFKILQKFKSEKVEKVLYEMFVSPQLDLRFKSACFFRKGRWKKRKRKVYKDKICTLFCEGGDWESENWFDGGGDFDCGDFHALKTILFGPKLEKVKSSDSGKHLKILFDTNADRVQFEYCGQKYVIEDLGKWDHGESRSYSLSKEILHNLDEFECSDSAQQQEGVYHYSSLRKLSAVAAWSVFSQAIHAKHTEGDWFELFLPNVSELNTEVADILSSCDMVFLDLGGLREMNSEVAACFANKGIKGETGLNLSGLRSLSDSVAESWSKYRGTLGLDGLVELSENSAKLLSKCEDELYLPEHLETKVLKYR